jgi:hypothetical protein
MNNSLVKILVTIGSIISIGFGLWHFFVPSIWDWYSYIVPEATELVIAIRAINFLFSLLLILLGVANILCVFKFSKYKFQTIIIFSISTILWATRVILQIVYPQGSQNQIIQYSMLVIFSIVLACFSISLLQILTQKEIIET